MMKLLNLLIFVILPLTIYAQKTDSLVTKRIGVIGSIDLAYNLHDKVLNPGLARKLAVGISFTNKKRQFIGFLALGIKGYKIDLYPQTFRRAFIKDVQENYVPIIDTNESQLIGYHMNAGGHDLLATYGQHAEIGILLNKGIRPSFSFYAGRQVFLLFDDEFAKYEDPTHGDIRYVGMLTRYFEFKIGCGLPSNAPHTFNFNIGYKWVNYGDLKFNDTPLSSYTSGSLKNKYGTSSGFTFSITFLIWSNYE